MEAGRGLDAVVKDYANWYISRLRWLEARLGEPGRSEFLCSQRFTVADICVTYALLLGKTLGLDDRYTPRVAAYLQRMEKRPALLEAYREQEAAIPAGAEAATPGAAKL